MPITNLEQVFTSKSIASNYNKYLETANMQPFLGQVFFEDKKQDSLKLEFIKGKAGLPVALMPSAFDSEVTIRDRIGVSVFNDEMPLFRDSFIIGEKERRKIIEAQSIDSPYLTATLNELYDDARKLIMGADVVAERMRMQLLAPVTGSPVISVKANGVDMSYNYDPNGEWSKTNFKKLTGKAMWTDYENADPIADIEELIQTASTVSGSNINVIIMTTKTLQDIMKCKKVQGYILSTVNGAVARISRKAVIDYITSEFNITVQIYDKKFVDEAGNVKSYYPDDMVTLLPNMKIGDTCYTQTPEEIDLLGGSKADVSIVGTGVAVTVITENKVPVRTQTVASEIVLPSYEGMDHVFCIKTAEAVPAQGTGTKTEITGE